MKRLILTTSASGAGGLLEAKLADCVFPLCPRFVWGPLPSPAELETRLSSRSARREEAPGFHWLDFTGNRLEEVRNEGPGLIEFCGRFEAVELWADPDPDDQLTLIWLLDYLRHHPETSSRLALIQSDVASAVASRKNWPSGGYWPSKSGAIISKPPAWPGRPTGNRRRKTGSICWSRTSTSCRSFGRSMLELLEELPMDATALGAVEARMLEIISAGDVRLLDVFPGHHKRLNNRRVFGYWETGTLLDGLAHCLQPAVSGLDEGPFTLEMHDDRDRYDRYRLSRLKLTTFGEAVLARSEDFSRHNPIHRWWGGTELTNDRLWRWDPANRILIAPRAA